jgi:two-component system sensor histidine kinase PhcS
MTGGSTSSYYGGLNIVMVAVTQLLIYSFDKAIKVCIIVITCYIVTIFLPPNPVNWASFYTNLHFLILTAIISCVACYLLTLHRVKKFKANYKVQTLLQEKEQTELKLIRSERLNAIGTLAAGIIHEINNPLNNIMAHIIYIEENEKRADILNAVNEIKTFGIEPIEKITSGLQDFCGNIGKAEPVLLSELIDFAKHLVWNSIRYLNVNINIKEDGKALVVKNDIILLFTNFFINSAYALKKAKRKLIDITVVKLKDSFLISFKDNGIGIEKKNLGEIFDPFFTTKPEGVGLGLGLSSCHRIVENHKGSLKVKSKKGEYTEFIFNLPCINKEEENVGK